MLTDIYNILDIANIFMLYFYGIRVLLNPMNTLNRDLLIVITFC